MPTLKTSFLINILGPMIPVVCSLITVPLFLHQIGNARYGVLSIVWVLLGYFGFIDLGLTRAAANALARLREAPQTERARVLVTTLVINLGLGILGSIILYVSGHYLIDHVLRIPEELKPEISQSFPWVVALFPIIMTSGVCVGALESKERFLTANILQGVGAVIVQLVPVLFALYISDSLAVIIPASVVARFASALLGLAIVYAAERPLRPHHFSHPLLPSLLRYGGWISISGVINPFLVSLDQIIIGATIGVSAVAPYSVAMNLILRSQIVPSALSRTIFPRLSHSNHLEAIGLSQRSIIIQAYIYATICGPAIVLTKLFFTYWVSHSFADTATSIAVLLFLGAWVNSIAFVPFEFLQSQGRPDLTAKFHLLELPVFAFLLWIFTSKLGLTGAALAWSLRCVLDAALLLYASQLATRRLWIILIPLPILAAVSIVTAYVELSIPAAAIASFCTFSLLLGLSIFKVVEIRNATGSAYKRLHLIYKNALRKLEELA